jgi:phosphopantothenoylcysteine decarboxylase/phosphopantothenate--cysteine ligase
VSTALEMEAAAMTAYGDTDAVIATAAVSDFRPAGAVDGKIKKDESPLSIALEMTPDILASFGRDKGSRVLIGFAAETRDVVAYAGRKLEEKNLDLVVANDVSAPGVGFGSDTNRVILVDGAGSRELPEMSKRELAGRIADELVSALERRVPRT